MKEELYTVKESVDYLLDRYSGAQARTPPSEAAQRLITTLTKLDDAGLNPSDVVTALVSYFKETVGHSSGVSSTSTSAFNSVNPRLSQGLPAEMGGLFSARDMAGTAFDDETVSLSDLPGRLMELQDALAEAIRARDRAEGRVAVLEGETARAREESRAAAGALLQSQAAVADLERQLLLVSSSSRVGGKADLGVRTDALRAGGSESAEGRSVTPQGNIRVLHPPHVTVDVTPAYGRVGELESRLAEYERRHEELSAALSEAHVTIAQLRAQVDQARTRQKGAHHVAPDGRHGETATPVSTAAEVTADALKEENESLRRELHESSALTGELSQRIRALEHGEVEAERIVQEKERQRIALDAAEKRLHSLGHSAQTWEARAVALETQLADSRRLVESLSLRARSEGARATELATQMAQADEKTVELVRKVAALEMALRESQSTVAVLERQLKDADTRVAAAEEELDACVLRTSSAEMELRAQRLATGEGGRDAASGGGDAGAGGGSELFARCLALERENVKVLAASRKLERALEDARLQTASVSDRNASLASDLSSVSSEVAELRATVRKAEGALKQAHMQAAAAELRASDLERQCGDLRAVLQERDEQTEDAQRRVNELSSERARLESRLEDSESDRLDARSNASKWKSKFLEIEARLQDAESRAAGLDIAASEYRQELDRLRGATEDKSSNTTQPTAPAHAARPPLVRGPSSQSSPRSLSKLHASDGDSTSSPSSHAMTENAQPLVPMSPRSRDGAPVRAHVVRHDSHGRAVAHVGAEGHGVRRDSNEAQDEVEELTRELERARGVIAELEARVAKADVAADTARSTAEAAVAQLLVLQASIVSAPPVEKHDGAASRSGGSGGSASVSGSGSGGSGAPSTRVDAEERPSAPQQQQHTGQPQGQSQAAGHHPSSARPTLDTIAEQTEGSPLLMSAEDAAATVAHRRVPSLEVTDTTPAEEKPAPSHKGLSPSGGSGGSSSNRARSPSLQAEYEVLMIEKTLLETKLRTERAVSTNLETRLAAVTAERLSFERRVSEAATKATRMEAELRSYAETNRALDMRRTELEGRLHDLEVMLARKAANNRRMLSRDATISVPASSRSPEPMSPRGPRGMQLQSSLSLTEETGTSPLGSASANQLSALLEMSRMRQTELVDEAESARRERQQLHDKLESFRTLVAAEKATWQAKVAELSEEVERLRREGDALRASLAVFENAPAVNVSRGGEAFQEAQARVTALELALDDAMSEISARDERMSELDAQVAAFASAPVTSQGSLEKVPSASHAVGVEAALTAAARAMEELEHERAQSAEERAAWEDERMALEACVVGLRAELTKLRTKHGSRSLSSDSRESRDSREGLAASSEAAARERELERDRERMAGDIAQLEQRLALAEAERQRESEHAAAQLAAMAEELSSTRAQVEELQAEVARLDAELSAAMKSAEQTLSMEDTRHARMLAEVDDLASLLRERDAELASERERAASLSARLADVEAERARMLDDMEETVAMRVQEQVAEYEDVLDRREAELAARVLTLEREGARDVRHSSVQAHVSLDESLGHSLPHTLPVVERITALEAALATTEDALREAEAENARLISRLASIDDFAHGESHDGDVVGERDELAERVHELEDALGLAESKVAWLEAQCAALSSKARQLEEEARAAPSTSAYDGVPALDAPNHSSTTSVGALQGLLFAAEERAREAVAESLQLMDRCGELESAVATLQAQLERARGLNNAGVPSEDEDERRELIERLQDELEAAHARLEHAEAERDALAETLDAMGRERLSLSTPRPSRRDVGTETPGETTPGREPSIDTDGGASHATDPERAEWEDERAALLSHLAAADEDIRRVRAANAAVEGERDRLLEELSAAEERAKAAELEASANVAMMARERDSLIAKLREAQVQAEQSLPSHGANGGHVQPHGADERASKSSPAPTPSRIPRLVSLRNKGGSSKAAAASIDGSASSLDEPMHVEELGDGAPSPRQVAALQRQWELAYVRNISRAYAEAYEKERRSAEERRAYYGDYDLEAAVAALREADERNVELTAELETVRTRYEDALGSLKRQGERGMRRRVLCSRMDECDRDITRYRRAMEDSFEAVAGAEEVIGTARTLEAVSRQIETQLGDEIRLSRAQSFAGSLDAVGDGLRKA